MSFHDTELRSAVREYDSEFVNKQFRRKVMFGLLSISVLMSC